MIIRGVFMHLTKIIRGENLHYACFFFFSVLY